MHLNLPKVECYFTLKCLFNNYIYENILLHKYVKMVNRGDFFEKNNGAAGSSRDGGIAGCSKEPQPQDRFAAYIKLWNEQKFDKMYDYLSEGAKEVITKEDFTSRYQKIYDDLQITDLKITFEKPRADEELPKDQDNVTYDFSAPNEQHRWTNRIYT